eukprot:g21986.t1
MTLWALFTVILEVVKTLTALQQHLPPMATISTAWSDNEEEEDEEEEEEEEDTQAEDSQQAHDAKAVAKYPTQVATPAAWGMDDNNFEHAFAQAGLDGDNTFGGRGGADYDDDKKFGSKFGGQAGGAQSWGDMAEEEEDEKSEQQQAAEVLSSGFGGPLEADGGGGGGRGALDGYGSEEQVQVDLPDDDYKSEWTGAVTLEVPELKLNEVDSNSTFPADNFQSQEWQAKDTPLVAPTPKAYSGKIKKKDANKPGFPGPAEEEDDEEQKNESPDRDHKTGAWDFEQDTTQGYQDELAEDTGQGYQEELGEATSTIGAGMGELKEDKNNKKNTAADGPMTDYRPQITQKKAAGAPGSNPMNLYQPAKALQIDRKHAGESANESKPSQSAPPAQPAAQQQPKSLADVAAAMSAGKWTCEICDLPNDLIKNGKKVVQCAACETPKPGEEAEQQPETQDFGGMTFGGGDDDTNGSALGQQTGDEDMFGTDAGGFDMGAGGGFDAGFDMGAGDAGAGGFSFQPEAGAGGQDAFGAGGGDDGDGFKMGGAGVFSIGEDSSAAATQTDDALFASGGSSSSAPAASSSRPGSSKQEQQQAANEVARWSPSDSKAPSQQLRAAEPQSSSQHCPSCGGKGARPVSLGPDPELVKAHQKLQAQFDQQNAEFKQACAKHDAREEALKRVFEDQKRETEMRRKQVEAMEQASEQEEARVRRAEEAMKEAQQILESTRDRLRRSEMSLADKTGILADKQRDLDAMRQEAVRIKQQLDQTARQNAQLGDLAERLQKQLATMKREQEETQFENERLRSRFKRIDHNLHKDDRVEVRHEYGIDPRTGDRRPDRWRPAIVLNVADEDYVQVQLQDERQSAPFWCEAYSVMQNVRKRYAEPLLAIEM